MRPDFIVMLSPLFDHDLGFGPVPEPLHRQALIPEFSVETLRRAVLPRFARSDQGHVEILVGSPSAAVPRKTNSGPLSERRIFGAPCCAKRAPCCAAAYPP